MDDLGTQGVKRCCDLHSHILPGLDDGASDGEVARQMLHIAEESGTTDIYATPHLISGSWLPTWEDIRSRVEELNRYAAEAGLTVRVRPGAEVAMDWELLDLLSAPGPYCLDGSRFILVELPLGSLPNYADDFLFTLQTRDFLPILAHPERNPDVKADPSCLQPWLDRGIYLQMNASSLAGHMGTRTKAAAQALVESGRVHFLGSDAHGVGVRRPDLRPAAAVLEQSLGGDAPRLILAHNPAQICTGRTAEIQAPCARSHPKAGWRSRLKLFWRKDAATINS